MINYCAKNLQVCLQISIIANLSRKKQRVHKNTMDQEFDKFKEEKTNDYF